MDNIFDISQQLIKEFHSHGGDILYVARNKQELTYLKHYLRFFNINCYLLPSFDVNIYDKLYPSNAILCKRAQILGTIATGVDKKILITSAENLFYKLPPSDYFINNWILLAPEKKYSIDNLVNQLSQNGFYRVSSVNTEGEFAQRGDIVDIALSDDQAYRIYFEWDVLHSIKKLNIADQRSYDQLTHLSIFPLSEMVLNSDLLDYFNQHFNQFCLKNDDHISYQAILKGRKCVEARSMLAMFFPKLVTIQQYLNKAKIFISYDITSIYDDFYSNAVYTFEQIKDSSSLLSPPSQILISKADLSELEIYNLPFKRLEQSSNFYLDAKRDFFSALDIACEFIASKIQNSKIIFACNSLKNAQNLEEIFYNRSFNAHKINSFEGAKYNAINIYLIELDYSEHQDMDQGFGSCVFDDVIIIPDSYIFGQNKAQSRVSNKSNKLQNFVLELNNFSSGEIIVHNDYGIAKFLGIAPITVEGIMRDYVKLLYANDDKVYIPVENIELIKKFGQGEPELDKLGASSWQRRKALLKNKLCDIAHKLIQTAANREIIKNPPISFNEQNYAQFRTLFPYVETDDQLSAIDDIAKDLSSGKLMDRLVCGDVGYGKTEVAMRAAFFLLDSDHTKQIAIISPTTILARQHFINFKERFNSSKFSIAHLSRFVAPLEQKKIKQQIKEGSINLIIGTHSLFSSSVEFANLGMIIIDEEHLFGVKQKEKLKNIKKDAHVLSLSATPIPRTLQMSLVGIKDLSLISTPPFARIPVKTAIISQDKLIIQDAISRELARGGKVFYVAPKVQELSQLYTWILSIDSALKVYMAHGQMDADELDKVLSDFYDGKFDVLLSTNIIQAGLDVPNANTIIVHNAHLFGLSQLHQLKGRVGRKKEQGYCYFVSDVNKISDLSYRRLHIIESASDLGAGFNIASHDIDIRGYGNLLGDQQSGHIKEVGVELYQEMLKEEISKIKQDQQQEKQDHQISAANFSPVLNLDLAIYIPDRYINDADLKLLTYRRIAKIDNQHDLESLIDELVDRFGPIPLELENLFSVTKLKSVCKKLLISNLDFGPKGIVIKFYQQAHLEKMIEFVTKYPKYSKIKKDGSIVLFKTIEQNSKLQEITKILTTLEKFINE